MKDICTSCLRYKKVAAMGLFIPHNGDKPVPYPVCHACVREAHSCLEHNEAIILGIEENLEKAGLIR